MGVYDRSPIPRTPSHHHRTHPTHQQAHPPFKKAWLQAIALQTERARADSPLDALAKLAGEGKIEGIFFGTKQPWLVPAPYHQTSPATGGGGNGAASLSAADVFVGVRLHVVGCIWC